MTLSIIVPSSLDNKTSDSAQLSRLYRDAQFHSGHTTMSDMAAMQRRVGSQTYAYRDRGDYSLERR